MDLLGALARHLLVNTRSLCGGQGRAGAMARLRARDRPIMLKFSYSIIRFNLKIQCLLYCNINWAKRSSIVRACICAYCKRMVALKLAAVSARDSLAEPRLLGARIEKAWPRVAISVDAQDSSQSDCSGWFGRVSQNEPSIAYKHQILTASCSYLAPAVTARVRADSRRARGRSHHIKMQVTRGYHMTAESAQPRKRSNVTRPFPFPRAGSGYETTRRRRKRGGVTAKASFPDSTSRMFGRWSLGTRLVYNDDVIAHHQRMV